ncbi:hypothetical protein OB955_19595 [Halobacteria archaeon AArc-m2/3/4]|uniref:Uncharacterized protein n=1 Tax=Natronoglomus mannanivorans TaxID=2979990 RepID=A0ABT2QJ12_9EURY|nr:hypothetical protein [Halobacteria archaeon AArc-m2/3/4]
MAELTIYDSQGNRYDDGDRASVAVSERIENFFFGGVRVYLDVGSTTELVVFFRARKTKSGRAEQYFAVYRTDTMNQLFTRFKEDLRRRVEGEYGMSLQTTSDDVELFAKLDSGAKPVPGTDEEHRVLSSLLEDGESLSVGTRDADSALALLYKYVQDGAGEIAIAENAGITDLEACDLTIELGHDDGFVPLDETESLFEQRFGLRSDDSTEVQPSRPRATESGAESDSSTLGSAVRVGAIAIGLVFALGILAVVAINGAAIAGIGVPSGFDPIVVADDSSTDDALADADSDEAEPSLEAVTVVGAESHSLTSNGEFVDSVTVMVDDNQQIEITGESNQGQVAFELADGEDVLFEDSRVANGPFNIYLSELSNGETTLTIAAGERSGDDDVGGDWVTIREEVTVTIEGVETAE